MLRKLMFVLCLAAATNAVAQKTPASKTTEKQDDAKIDYQEMGAPMPPLRLRLFHDTTTKKNMPVADSKAGSEKKERRSKKGKKNDDKNKTYLTADDVDNGANLLVMIFNPSCSHCEDETAVIQNNISLFRRSQLVMVAKPSSSLPMGDFYTRRRLHEDQYKSIHIGTDSSDFISKTFIFGMLPQINIYNSERTLIKTFNGEIAIDSLKKYIE